MKDTPSVHLQRLRTNGHKINRLLKIIRVFKAVATGSLSHQWL